MGWGGCSDKNLAKYSAIYHKRVSTAGVWTPSALGPLWRGPLSLGCPHLQAAVEADHQSGTRQAWEWHQDWPVRKMLGPWGLGQDYHSLQPTLWPSLSPPAPCPPPFFHPKPHGGRPSPLCSGLRHQPRPQVFLGSRSLGRVCWA